MKNNTMGYTTFFKLGAAVIVIAAIVAAAAFVRDGAKESAGGDLDRLASIALNDYKGRAVSLAAYKSRPLVINSWAVWCPFCRQELPDFAALQETFPDITVIAIDRQESLERAKGYTDELGISDKMVFLLDSDDAFYKNIGGFSMPETIFVDVSGRIVFHKRGPMTLEEMRAAVDQYLR